ncbi:MAG: YbjN domain-containing protein [Actinomycetota bacterium]|nr:YbjN domain-containing protein [Actinomycetota bacterium]MDH4015805.1 YbjN domain-containing protein [Actinomycetota bacterium]
MTRSSAVISALAELLDAEGLEHERPEPDRFVIVLPGRAKLRTTVSMVVGTQALSINAFVARQPDENAEGVYRWLLQQNTRMLGIAFALDGLGDIYLVGRVPTAGLGPEDLDRLLGSVLRASDDSFNTILRLGFASSIRKERAWRDSRGESTANLEAFAELTDDAQE